MRWKGHLETRRRSFARHEQEISTLDAGLFSCIDYLYLREEVCGSGLWHLTVMEIARLELTRGGVNVQFLLACRRLEMLLA